jgi:hypothetical protein
MGRFATENGDAKGTNDETSSEDDGTANLELGPNLWVTETALDGTQRQLMAEQLSLFSLVVGIALLLAGVGFIVLPTRPCVRHPSSHRPLRLAPPASACWVAGCSCSQSV